MLADSPYLRPPRSSTLFPRKIQRVGYPAGHRCVVRIANPIAWGAVVPPRRLEDRIREICQQPLTARSAGESDTILAELRSALHEHSRRVRKRFLTLVFREKGYTQERRAV